MDFVIFFVCVVFVILGAAIKIIELINKKRRDEKQRKKNAQNINAVIIEIHDGKTLKKYKLRNK